MPIINHAGGQPLLPEWLLGELMSPPDNDRHQWIFRMALKLVRYRPVYEAKAMLRGACARVSRSVPEREISDAVMNAARIVGAGTWTGAGTHGSLGPPADKWPDAIPELTDKIVMAGPHTATSPYPIDPRIRHTEPVIDAVYPGDPLLCVARRGSWDFLTASREELRGMLDLCSLLVPSPMTARWGLTQNGRASAHTLQAVGPRRIVAIEFDFTKTDEAGKPTIWKPWIERWEAAGITIEGACIALLLHLAISAPLVLITHSGGKSDHGWFMASGRPEARLRRWMEYAVKLGACKSTWGRSQFVRVPDGTRYPDLKGLLPGQPVPPLKRQWLRYFNPSRVL